MPIAMAGLMRAETPLRPQQFFSVSVARTRSLLCLFAVGKVRAKHNLAKEKHIHSRFQLRTKTETGESCGKGQKRDEIECAGALDLKNDVERYLWQ